MVKKNFKLFLLLLAAIIISGFFYLYSNQISDFASPAIVKINTLIRRQIAQLYPACSKPILYSLGVIDPRFRLTREEIVRAAAEAGNIWSQPFGQALFAYATTGELKINFVYDIRQQTTDQLKELGVIVGDDRKTYDNLKAKRDLLNDQYWQQNVALRKQAAAYQDNLKSYNAEVAKWNKRGGAPAEVYSQLEAAQKALDDERLRVNAATADLNRMIDEFNTVGRALNKLADQLNLNVGKYNDIGDQTGEQFEAGVYDKTATSTSINVFEFNDRQELVRLLAHELGHALGLDHTSSSEDIMYYLNESKNSTATAADLAALRARCEKK